MYFSVIIPTYNPKQWLPRLLDSISDNDCANDIEVIISDDCSTEPFDDVLERYQNLNIKCISNEKHCGFPRNGRQHGADVAIGEWMCFADQDDYFLSKAFDTVKAYIRDNDMHNYFGSNFIVEYPEIDHHVMREGLLGWTHGKFYERKFWEESNVHYPDVKYNEDTALSTFVSCVSLDRDDIINPEVMETPVYVWCHRHDSLSNEAYFLRSIPDYVKATMGVILDFIPKYSPENERFGIYVVMFIRSLLHAYFIMQTRIFINDRSTFLPSMSAIRKYLVRFREITGIVNDEIIRLLNSDLLALYNDTRDTDCRNIPFVEQISFKDWLKMYFR